MRNTPPFQQGTIQAKNARIFWDCSLNQVAVVEVGQPLPHNVDKFKFSGGACYKKWQEICDDSLKAQVMCLKEFWNLVYIYEIDPTVIDSAFSVITEYQEAFLLNQQNYD